MQFYEKIRLKSHITKNILNAATKSLNRQPAAIHPPVIAPSAALFSELIAPKIAPNMQPPIIIQIHILMYF